MTKRPPTPARFGDTLDTIATFYVPRDLYESERKEIYVAISNRLAELKKARRKTAELLGIPMDTEKDITRVIALYEDEGGIISLFRTEADDETDDDDDADPQLDIEDAIGTVDSSRLADTQREDRPVQGVETPPEASESNGMAEAAISDLSKARGSGNTILDQWLNEPLREPVDAPVETIRPK